MPVKLTASLSHSVIHSTYSSKEVEYFNNDHVAFSYTFYLPRYLPKYKRQPK